MTDIIERLLIPVMLHTDAAQTNAERLEAKAEIERLRELMSNNDTVLKRHLSDASAEIERLRGRLAALNLCEPGFLGRKLRELDEAKAEIKRLREENKQLLDTLHRVASQYCIEGVGNEITK